MNETTRELCEALNDRLQAAEQRLRASLNESEGDHPLVEPAQDLLAIHKDIRSLLLQEAGLDVAAVSAEEHPEVAMAAVEIQDEAHTLKANVKDVVKALFMWKDDPVERVKGVDQ
jgi:hypothetical protein